MLPFVLSRDLNLHFKVHIGSLDASHVPDAVLADAGDLFVTVGPPLPAPFAACSLTHEHSHSTYFVLLPHARPS